MMIRITLPLSDTPRRLVDREYRTSKEPLIGVIVENYSKYELQEPRSHRVETNLSSVDPGTLELFVWEREVNGVEVGQFRLLKNRNSDSLAIFCTFWRSWNRNQRNCKMNRRNCKRNRKRNHFVITNSSFHEQAAGIAIHDS